LLVLLVFLITLHTKHQEQSHLADSPTERNALIEVETSLIQEGSHGGQGTMWKIFINFKKTIMKLNNLSSQFASQFAETSLTSLVNSFNAQVGNRGFNSARAAYDDALMQEFIPWHIPPFPASSSMFHEYRGRNSSTHIERS